MKQRPGTNNFWSNLTEILFVLTKVVVQKVY